jgi:hypothetical protein
MPTTQRPLVVFLRPESGGDERIFGERFGAVSASLKARVPLDVEVAGLKLVTGIKGKSLFVYESEDGQVKERLPADQFELPLVIMRSAPKGRLLVVHPKTGEEFWILKAQAITNEGQPEVTVDCQSITESYAAARGFGDCN